MPFESQNADLARGKVSLGSASSRFLLMQPKYELPDIVLQEQQLSAIEEVLSLSRYENLIYHTWGLGTVIKRGRGLKVNLFGSPGTGKTMVAHAIAKELDKPLLEVSYAEIESKFVGETSKNLVALFRTAETEGAVLLFDEADALLSKRVTDMQSSSDVSVNQTRSVLLKLLDAYEGICLFTTNFIKNYDPAFLRRITRHIQFPLPDEAQRVKLWEHYLVASLPCEVDIPQLAAKSHGLSGSDIANAVLNAAIRGAARKAEKIPTTYFEEAIQEILAAKQANSGSEVTVSTREVSEGYAKQMMQGGAKR